MPLRLPVIPQCPLEDKRYVLINQAQNQRTSSKVPPLSHRVAEQVWDTGIARWGDVGDSKRWPCCAPRSHTAGVRSCLEAGQHGRPSCQHAAGM